MICRMIDHTLLKTDATAAQIETLCKEATEYHFASVCVSPCYVAQAAQLLKDTDVKVCTVVGFPQGANMTTVKAFETKQAVQDGADEVDMVIRVGALKAGDTQAVEEDIAAVVQNAGTALVKVIIECCLLSDEEKRTACLLAKKAGAHYVKTSTGMSTGGATAHDVRLMREAVGEEMGVKAAGGIRDYETAKVMIASGATRIGTSNGIQIAREAK